MVFYLCNTVELRWCFKNQPTNVLLQSQVTSENGHCKTIIPSPKIIHFHFPAGFNTSCQQRKAFTFTITWKKGRVFYSLHFSHPILSRKNKASSLEINSPVGKNQIPRLQYLLSKAQCFLIVFAFVMMNTHLKWLEWHMALSDVAGGSLSPVTPPDSFSPSLLYSFLPATHLML